MQTLGWVGKTLAVFGLVIFTGCRFGNREIPAEGPSLTDEFSHFEIIYKNTKDSFEFCVFAKDENDVSTEYCAPGDIGYTPSYVTQVLTDPIGLSRFMNPDTNSIYWALYNPNQNPLTKVFKVPFDQTTGEIFYTSGSDVVPLWSAVDSTQCMTQQATMITGNAVPEQKTLGLVYREYDLYADECIVVLQRIADCLNGIAGKCSATELTQWQNYFDPWVQNLGLEYADIPLLQASGFKVSFR